MVTLMTAPPEHSGRSINCGVLPDPPLLFKCMSWPVPSGSFEGLDMITGQQLREELQGIQCERVPSPRASLARSWSGRGIPAESNPDDPVRLPNLPLLPVLLFVTYSYLHSAKRLNPNTICVHIGSRKHYSLTSGVYVRVYTEAKWSLTRHNVTTDLPFFSQR